MKKRFIKEKPFLIFLSLLVLAGLFFLSSASTAESAQKFNTIYYYTLRQLLWISVGVLAFLVAQAIPLKYYKILAPFLFGGSIFLLLLVFVPHIGASFGGARRWIHLGIITIQPAEIAKFAIILALAWWYSRIRLKVKSVGSGLLVTVGILALAIGPIILQPDLGTAIVIIATGFLIYLVAGGRFVHIFACLVLGIILIAILVYVAPYRHGRVTVFLHPETDQQGMGFQVRQASISIGSGGLWGTGYGSAQQKPNFLPEPIGDSIFAIIAEEFGLLGGLSIVILYFMLFLRGVVIIRSTDDSFAKLVATGIMTTIVFQAFLNIGAISGLLPLTGIPLPLISYGGTSLVMTFAALGVVYGIAKLK